MSRPTAEAQSPEHQANRLFPGLKWLSAEEAAAATRHRDDLLRSLAPETERGFHGNKLHVGPLSPGCARCVSGTWSCAFFSSACNASCFFCPSSREAWQDNALCADMLMFGRSRNFADYVDRLGFNGASFSGGEPLLLMGKVLEGLAALRKTSGQRLHLWLYTNGLLVTENRLKRLRAAGLDEMRFNICAAGYDLKAVSLAVKFIPTVTVEIPMIPEDYERVRNLLGPMKRIGVKHLNLHQLYVSRGNHRAFGRRGYTGLRLPCTPTLESELAALRILRAALDGGVGIPINYCSMTYRDRVTAWSRRRRAAALMKMPCEDVTGAGYLRRFAIRGPRAELANLSSSLARNMKISRLWSRSDDPSEIYCHPRLIEALGSMPTQVTLRYFECQLRQQPDQKGAQTKRIRLNAEMTVCAQRMLRGEYTYLSPKVVDEIARPLDPAQENELLESIAPFEHLKEGFPELS
ncbi:MAG: radical SAM protein [Elusimicrobia bacterium]|nr:radical SAM protein [Elusimicrobiota bacterium]